MQTAGATSDVNLRASSLRKAGEYINMLGRKAHEDEVRTSSLFSHALRMNRLYIAHSYFNPQTAMLACGFYLLWSGDSEKAKQYFNSMRQKKVSEVLTQIG